MTAGSAATVVRDVEVLATGEQVDVTIGDPAGAPPATSPVDGSHLVCLPGLFDADQSWPVVDFGVRAGDRHRALRGGAMHVATAVPWDRIAPSTPASLAAQLAPLRFPQLVPVLAVPRPGSGGFAEWLARHAAELREAWPPVCRLFSSDPNFARNLDAVWSAGLVAAVFCSEPEGLDRAMADGGGPLHLRHATTGEVVRRAAARPSTTVQTSPHFLLPVDPARAAELHVRPPVPAGPAARRSLLDAFDEVDVLASDHGGPVVGRTGPGLDVAALFLPTVLALADLVPGGLAAVLPKATTVPAAAFGVAGRLVESLILVDLDHRHVVAPDADQEPRRAPYLGMDLPGRVVAVAHGSTGFFL